MAHLIENPKLGSESNNAEIACASVGKSPLTANFGAIMVPLIP